MQKKSIKQFQKTVHIMGEKNFRNFSWRRTKNPFHILVSEVMLQQTQAGERTIRKYEAFIERFPTVEALATAHLKDVLLLWRGLGYNRRAKALRDSARIIVTRHNGKIPKQQAELEELPGVGSYTAAAVLAFAFNKPAVLIETNIRSVFIHSFFNDTNKKIADRDILPLIEETLDEKNPRTWYCALMDYGAVLKKSNTAITKRSAHYKQQGAFKGSTRYIRGSIIKLFEEKQVWSQQMMEHNIKEKSAVVKQHLNQLTKEGLLTKHGRFYLIAD